MTTELKLNQPVSREAVVRSLSPEMIEKRQVEFVISTETVDTYGTVFRMAGWKLDRYQANPLVVYVHRASDPNPDMIVGTSEVFIENNQLVGRVTFEPAEINPLAEKVFRKIQAGTLRMASIGANPLKGHWGDEKLGENRDVLYFDEQELLEWSIVPLGSNPDALKRNADSMAAIRAEMAKNIEITDAVVETPNRSIRERMYNHNLKSKK